MSTHYTRDVWSDHGFRYRYENIIAPVLIESTEERRRQTRNEGINTELTVAMGAVKGRERGATGEKRNSATHDAEVKGGREDRQDAAL